MKSIVCLLIVALMMLAGSYTSLYAQAEEAATARIAIQIGEDGQPIIEAEGINADDIHVEVLEGEEIIGDQGIVAGDASVAIQLSEILQQQGGVAAEVIGEATEIVGEVVQEAPGVAIAIGGGEGIRVQVGSEGEAETVTSYWLGVLCTPLPEAVRAQVNIPSDLGLIIEQVVPGSPAAEAGLQRHDILLAAGDAALGVPQDLVSAVAAGEGKTMLLKVLRRGETVEIEATPDVRTITAIQRRGPFALHIVPHALRAEEMEEAVRIQIEAIQEQVGEGLPLRFHMMRPGVIVESVPNEGGANAEAVATGAVATTAISINVDGAQITIKRTGDDPAEIRIEQDGEVIETTEENIDAVPEELRPRVEQMLKAGPVMINATGPAGVNIGVVPHFQGRIHAVPMQPSIEARPVPQLVQPPIEARPIPHRVQPSMSQQLEQMQRQLEELRRQIEELEQE